jgi:excisionase family DNA binding protein
MPEIMTTQEMAKYLKVHQITISKLAGEGKIPAIRIGRVWRFDKIAIDKWIRRSQKNDIKKEKKVSSGDTNSKKIKRRQKGIKIAASTNDIELQDNKPQSVIYKLRKKGKIKSEV